jgi:hypothetical protein
MDIIKDHGKYPQAKFNPSLSLSICHSRSDKIENRIRHPIVLILVALRSNHHMDKGLLAHVTIQEMGQL